MTQVVAQMSVSLDGFYAGPRDPRDPRAWTVGCTDRRRPGSSG